MGVSFLPLFFCHGGCIAEHATLWYYLSKVNLWN